MLRLFAITLLVILSPALFAQGLMDRKRPNIIPLEGQARRSGFYFAPGVTYTLPRSQSEEQTMFQEADTAYRATYDPSGRFGLYFEAGWYLATRDPVVLDYWDVGLAYKNLRGSESFQGLLTRGDTAVSSAGEGVFAERLLTLHVNANKFLQTGDYQFIQLSLGANADYRLGATHDHSGDPFLNQHDFPPSLIGQLHVKLGYGFKLTGRLLLIPAVETPVFSVIPTDQGLGQLQWFSSRYRPLIFSVRFLFLRARPGFDCPPPIRKNGDGRRKKYKPDNYHP